MIIVYKIKIIVSLILTQYTVNTLGIQKKKPRHQKMYCVIVQLLLCLTKIKFITKIKKTKAYSLIVKLLFTEPF